MSLLFFLLILLDCFLFRGHLCMHFPFLFDIAFSVQVTSVRVRRELDITLSSLFANSSVNGIEYSRESLVEYDYDDIVYPIPFNELVEKKENRYKDFNKIREGFPSFIRYGSVEPSLNIDKEFAIVTGASDNHASCLVSVLYSSLLTSPYSPLIIVDYGISNSKLSILLSNVSRLHSIRHSLGSEAPIYYRKYNFAHFPAWSNINEPHSKGGYSWKVITLFDVLTEYKGVVMWTDAGSILGNSEIDVSRARVNGFYSFVARHSIGKWTHNATYQCIEDMKWASNVNSVVNKTCCSGGYMIIDYWNRTVMTNVVYPFVKCSLTKRCIAPTGSSRWNHRQDQSALSIFIQSFGINQACDANYSASVHFHRDYARRLDSDKGFLRAISTKYKLNLTSILFIV